MKKIRFLLSLWAGKLVLWYYKKTNRVNNDRPGMRSLRIFFDFVRYVNKPKTVIAVTGTNGKTSTTKIIAGMFESQGYSVAYNSWGANDNAGYARLFLDAVTIFNKPTKDVALVEMDEITIAYMLEMVQPQYLIINNLAQDSLHRNANVDYVASRIQIGCNKYPKVKLIVNGDDPTCIGIGEKNPKAYFGVADQGKLNAKYLINDFPVCPKCGGTPVYEYKTFRQLGQFHCPECGYKSPERDYFVKKIKKDSIIVKDKNGEHEYPVFSDTLFNIYNEAAVITLFSEMGYQPEKIAELLKTAKLPATRDRVEFYKGMEIRDLASKGQNPTAMSTTMEYVKNLDGNKSVMLLYDELLPEDNRVEATSYIYSTDYEFLNDEKIKQVIVLGYRCRDHKIRLLLAGVDPAKICIANTVYEVDQFIDPRGIDKYIILRDYVYTLKMSDYIINAIKQKIDESEGK